MTIGAISCHEMVMRTFASVEVKDLEGLIEGFTDDAVVIDPHFPIQKMIGKQAIKKGFQGAMNSMRSFGYTVVNYCTSEDGQCVAVETSTHHVLKHGKKLDFSQVFIFQMENGYIKRLQAYEPYGPHGLVGMFLWLVRLIKWSASRT